MRRIAVVAAVAVVALVAAALLAVGRGHGHSNASVASVGPIEISRHDLDLTVQHFHDEAAAEGRPFPAAGSASYRQVERQALSLLLDRAKLELAARRIGVRVTDAEVAQRTAAGGTGEQEGGGALHADAEAAFARGTAKTQLLTEAVFKRVTAPAAVSAAGVRAYYRSHRSVYGRERLSTLRGAIAAQLLAAKKNALMARWLARAHAAPAVIADGALKKG